MDEGTVGSRIRQKRILKGWTQKRLADETGVFEKTVSRWENNRRVPGEEELDRVALALDTTKAYLRYGGADAPGTDVAAQSLDLLSSGQRPVPRVLQSQRVRVWLSEFRLELTKLGVDDDRIAEALDLVTSPAVFTYYHGGPPGEFNEDEAIVAMEAIAKFVRQTIARRQRKMMK